MNIAARTAIAVAAVWIGGASAANGQTTTHDSRALAKLAKKLAQLTTQTATMAEITKASNDLISVNSSIHDIIGKVGRSTEIVNGVSPNALMADLSIGANQAVSNGVQRLTGSSITALQSMATSAMAPIEQAMTLHQANTLPTTGDSATDSMIGKLNAVMMGTMNASDAAGALRQGLFSLTADPKNAAVQMVYSGRLSLLQSSITGALAEADALTQSTQDRDAKAATTLDTDRTQASNLRARIQVNTASVTKSVDEERSATIMLSDLLRLESAHTVSQLPALAASTAGGPADDSN